VIGVSGDTVEGQKLFKSEKSLDYTLLADEKGTVAKAFGIPVGGPGVFKYKDAAGTVHELKRGCTISRYHVVIDATGTIAAIDPVKDARGDARQVLEILRKLEK
jgi:thioredoxin-dependent peroxiredoxin